METGKEKKISSRTVAYAVTVFFASLVLLLLFTAPIILNRQLNQIQFDFQKQTFQLQNKNIKFQPLKLGFTIEGFEIVDVDQPSNHLFDCESLSIQNINLFTLLFQSEIIAKKVRIDESNTKFDINEILEQNQLTNNDFNKLNFNRIILKEIVFSNARIAYSSFENLKSAFTLPKIDLVLKGFEISNENSQQKTITVSDFLLRANNFSINIIEDTHRLNMDEIQVSLLNNAVVATNVRLAPRTKNNSSKLLFWANIPEVSLKATNLNNFLKSDSIQVELCRLDYPEFNIEAPNKKSHSFNLQNFNLSQLLKDELKQILIKRIVVWNGNATVTNKETKKIQQALSRINLKVFDLLVNENSWKNTDRVFGAKGILLDLEKLVFDNNDGIHRLTVNKLKFDTRIKNLSSGFISYSPVSPSKNLATIDFNSTGIYMRDVNFHEAIQNFKIKASQFNIKTPDLTINRIQKKNSKKTKPFSEKLKNFFNTVNIKQVSLNEGYLNIVTKGENESNFKTRFDVNLNDINIHKNYQPKETKLFYANQFDIQLSGTSFSMPNKLHQIATEEISFSSRDDIAAIKNFRIIANDDQVADSIKFNEAQQYANVTIPNIKLNNTKLHALFTKHELIAESLLFSEPRFSIDQYSNKKQPFSSLNLEKNLGRYFKSYFEKIIIERITLSEGRIYFTNFKPNKEKSNWSNSFTLKLNEFHFPIVQPAKNEHLLFSENIDLTLNKFNFDFPNGTHNLAIDQINLNTENKLLKLNKIRLFPDFNNSDFGGLPYKLMFSSPSISISNFNVNELLSDENLNVGTINIESPDAQLVFSDSLTNKQSNSAKQINSGIELHVQDFKINGGVLSLAKMKNNKEQAFSTIDFNTQLKNFSYKIADNSYNFKNLIFNSNYFNYQINENYNLSIGKIHYDQDARNLVANDLYIGALKKLKNNTDKTHFDISAAHINLSAFDILRATKEQKLIGNILEIQEPNISQTPGKKTNKTGFDPYNLNLYDKIKSRFETVSINKVLLKNAGYTINKNEPKYIRNIDITGVGFNIDAFSNAKELPFNFRSLNVKLANFSGKTSTEYYNYSVKGIELDSRGIINIRQMTLMPSYARKEFFERKQYQDDYFNINLRFAKIRNVDFKQFLKTNEFIAKSVEFDFEKINIFRDKRLELPPNRRTQIPSEILRELDQKITIDEGTFRCDHLTYEEMEPQARKESQIFFTNLEGTSKNVSNITPYVKQNPQSSLNITGDIFGVGKMNVDFTFELQSKINEFAFSATCGKMPLMLANTISEPGLKLSIKDGINQKLEVNFIANEDSAIGNMRFYYNDLKVGILEQKNGKLKEQGLITFVANTLVNSDNPRQPGKPVEMGYFINKRDKQRSIIQYCWRSIFEGMKSSIGMKEKD